jgi:hypothetical protein
MARAIKLRRLNLTNVSYQFVGAYRLRVEVADVAGGMERAIFVCHRSPYNPVTGEQLDTFFALAGPADIADFPADDPDPEKSFPFFRRDWFEVDVRATRVADEVWETVKREACVLAAALDRMERLEVTEEVWCCAAPAEDGGGSSESASESASESTSTSTSV